ncbi:MAG: L-histidine N(alpha)-methyltransferase [Thermoguttaceae bacterium]|jgi:dimethylhistidine N-methyltransferase
MHATYEVLPTRGHASPAAAFARDVLQGLLATPKSLPARSFYDERGSRLFQEIMELPEYYLTRCEREILHRGKCQLAGAVAREPFRLVELGAGDGRKTRILLRHFLAERLEFNYVPVDICRETIADLADSLHHHDGLATLSVHGIVAEYFDALHLLSQRSAERNFVLFLGSNIGNFDPFDARQFLAGLRESLNPGDLVLIGFDLKKAPEILHRAYNDAQGITREFNLNLLDRINRELGGRFDRRRFVHYGSYNVLQSRMESWLVSTEAQRVEIRQLGEVVTLEPWEGIHVECSYKYDLSEIETMADSTGFCVQAHLFDAQKYFVDSLWQVAK